MFIGIPVSVASMNGYLAILRMNPASVLSAKVLTGIDREGKRRAKITALTPVEKSQAFRDESYS